MSELIVTTRAPDVDARRGEGAGAAPEADADIILSFDVEEHDRIEAAAGLRWGLGEGLREEYRRRVAPVTRWILELLEARGAKATFFIVGEYAEGEPGLVREIHGAGHEVASHGWDHRRVLAMTPSQFREDARRSKDALEQITGAEVAGYRAPTFSIVRRTAWALDVLAEEGYRYDSSIYPVMHDRYGVPGAPRGPFLAGGGRRTILELPPATLRVLGTNLPAGGGGYFRLFPPAVMAGAIGQARRGPGAEPGAAMLYMHPWEFDPNQPRLPLGTLGRFRTYVGVGRTRRRLADLLARHRCARAVDVADRLLGRPGRPPRFAVAEGCVDDPAIGEAAGSSRPALT